MIQRAFLNWAIISSRPEALDSGERPRARNGIDVGNAEQKMGYTSGGVSERTLAHDRVRRARIHLLGGLLPTGELSLDDETGAK